MPKEFSLPLERHMTLNHAYNLYRELSDKKNRLETYKVRYHLFKDSIFEKLHSCFIIDQNYCFIHNTGLILNSNNEFVQKKFFNFYEELVVPELSRYKSDIKMKNENFAVLEQKSVLTSISFKPQINYLSFNNIDEPLNQSNFHDSLSKNKIKDFWSFQNKVDYHYSIVSSVMDYLIDFYQSPEDKLVINLDVQDLPVTMSDYERIS
jgi:hypothetical protein